LGSVFKRPDSEIWWITFSRGGRRFRQSADTTRKQEAQALLAKLEHQAFEAQHFPAKRKAGLSVAGLRDKWLEAKAHKRSLRADKTRFETIVEHFGASTMVSSILGDDVIRFAAELAATRVRGDRLMSTASVNRHLALLRSALRFASKQKWATGEALDAIELQPERNERDRICTREEFKKLIATRDGELRLAIVIAFHTAMRLGEIVALTWSRVDLKQRIIKLGAGDTKTNAGRKVPLRPEVIVELERWPRAIDGGHLFQRTSDDLSSRFHKLCAKLEIEDLRFHDLRHTALTSLRRGGVDVFTMQAISGHKTIAMLRRYQSVDEDDLRAAIDKVRA
jgi:integrase